MDYSASAERSPRGNGHMLNAPVLGEVCAGRNNHLNLIRMVAATAVLVSHAWPISLGSGTVEPLERLLGGITLGTTALYVFFALSGFLIARSFERQPTIRRWCAARVLRIFPALIVVLLLTALALGPAVTNLPARAYLTHPETFSYVPRNLSLAFLQYDLPGVFSDQPYPGVINGSLWTLVYEVVCYGGVLLAGLAGVLRRPSLMALGLSAFALAYILVFHAVDAEALPRRVRPLLELTLPFVIGMAFHVWRDHVSLHPVIPAGLAVLAVLAYGTLAWTPLFVLAVSWGIFVLGYMPSAFLHRYNRLGDYSYGVYIYAFPMQQLVVHLFQPLGPLANIALAFPATLLLAAVSWFWIEKPALALLRRPEGRGTGAAGRSSVGDPPPFEAQRCS